MDSLSFQKFAFALVIAIVVGGVFGYFFYDNYGTGLRFSRDTQFQAFHQKRFILTVFSTIAVSLVTFFGLRFFTK